MAVITLTDANNGEVIRVRQGDEIVLGLPENASTGYRWHVARADGLDEKEMTGAEAAPSRQPGSGGVRKFRFAPKAPGSARLELIHWRHWEGEKSVIARFAVDIVVTE
jgi:inhibitor of cysteine peptidase